MYIKNKNSLGNVWYRNVLLRLRVIELLVSEICAFSLGVEIHIPHLLRGK